MPRPTTTAPADSDSDSDETRLAAARATASAAAVGDGRKGTATIGVVAEREEAIAARLGWQPSYRASLQAGFAARNHPPLLRLLPDDSDPEPATPAKEPAPATSGGGVPRALREAVRRIDGGYGDPNLRRYLPTGLTALDESLPGHGLPSGAVTECCGDVGSGRTRFVTQIVQQVLTLEGGVAMLIESPIRPGARRPRSAGRSSPTMTTTSASAPPSRAASSRNGIGRWYAPGFAQAGLPLDRVVLVQPRSPKDAVWAAEQALMSGAVRALVLRDADPMDLAAVRRLQLAAEQGNAIVLLLRPAETAASRASAAAVRLLFEAERATAEHPRFSTTTHVTITRCRGGGAGTTIAWQTVLPAAATADTTTPPPATTTYRIDPAAAAGTTTPMVASATAG